jgi:hypothetical protein
VPALQEGHPYNHDERRAFSVGRSRGDDGGVTGRRAIAPPLYALVAALGGSSQGFVTVTLGYVLAERGVSVAAIATLVGLRLLPETWRILFGPLLDTSLTPRVWYLISAVGVAISTLLFGLLPVSAASLRLFDLLALAQGAFANVSIVA